MSTSKLNRMSANEATQLARTLFGADYYATSYSGHRRICRTISAMSMSNVSSAKTWAEAFQSARSAIDSNV